MESLCGPSQKEIQELKEKLEAKIKELKKRKVPKIPQTITDSDSGDESTQEKLNVLKLSSKKI